MGRAALDAQMDLARTPFHAAHVAHGARMVPFAGFDMPVQYRGVAAEHNQVRSSVGLFDVSHMGEIRVRGPAAAESLSWLLTNAVRRLEVGHAQYNAICNERGGVVDDVYAYRIGPDDFLVCVNAANRAKDWAWLTAHDRHGASFEDQGDQWAQVAIQGPRGVDVVAALAGDGVRALRRPQFGAMPFAGVDGCIVARTGYTGEDGFEVFVPADRAEPVWQRILDAGRPWAIEPIGLGARDTLRLEAANCLYGHELDDETSPLAAGLGWIVKLGKPGGFLGADALGARDDARRLCGLVVEGRIAREGMAVWRGGVEVGRVTSGTVGPFVGRNIALAYVDRGLSDFGTPLEVDVRGRPTPARVVETPFHRRAKETP
jgi:aminomethyltransferase